MALPPRVMGPPDGPPTLRSCPVCGARGGGPVGEKPGVRLVRCGECGMVHTPDVAPEFRTGDHYVDAGQAYYLTPDKLGADYHPVRYERELRLFRRFCSRGRVLDVGCGTGGFLHQLSQRFPGGYEVHGHDVSTPALEHAWSMGVQVHPGDFLQLDLPEGGFQAVTLWAVLEHLPEPGAFVARAARLVAAGGHVLLLVPNWNSLARRLLGLRYRYVLPEHLNYFTAATLRRLTARTPDLEPVFAGTTHFNPMVILQDWRRGGAPVPAGERGALLQRTNRWKTHPGLAPLRLLYRIAEFALAGLDLADNLVLVLRRPE